MNVPKIEEFISNPKGFVASYFKKRYPEWVEYVKKEFPAPKLIESIYQYFNGKEHACIVCGKPTTFESFFKGYRTYCCISCQRKATEQKRRQTCLERYGSETYNNMEKNKRTKLERYGNEYYTNRTKKVAKPVPKPKPVLKEIPKTTPKVIPCTNLIQFVCDILDRHNIIYSYGTNGCDIYIEHLHMGIDCCSIKEHSTRWIPNTKYQFNKWLNCKNNDIRLITLWEDWIRTKPEIIESMILAKVGKSNNSIYARKCEVRQVPSKMAAQFLNKNHIQGRCNASIHMGLFYENELVSLMSFSVRSKLSGAKTYEEGEWELIRFANKCNTRVVGAAGKLLTHFIREVHPTIITSFACNDISDGNLYRKLGFTEGTINTAYWYVQDGTFIRYHRSTFTRSGICKHWPFLDINDKRWTERMVMESPISNYWRIHDTGTTNWRLVIAAKN